MYIRLQSLTRNKIKNELGMEINPSENEVTVKQSPNYRMAGGEWLHNC